MENCKIILFDNDIFLKQKYGGIRTYFTNLILHIKKLKNVNTLDYYFLENFDIYQKNILGKKYLI